MSAADFVFDPSGERIERIQIDDIYPLRLPLSIADERRVPEGQTYVGILAGTAGHGLFGPPPGYLDSAPSYLEILNRSSTPSSFRFTQDRKVFLEGITNTEAALILDPITKFRLYVDVRALGIIRNRGVGGGGAAAAASGTVARPAAADPAAAAAFNANNGDPVNPNGSRNGTGGGGGGKRKTRKSRRTNRKRNTRRRRN